MSFHHVIEFSLQKKCPLPPKTMCRNVGNLALNNNSKISWNTKITHSRPRFSTHNINLEITLKPSPTRGSRTTAVRTRAGKLRMQARTLRVSTSWQARSSRKLKVDSEQAPEEADRALAIHSPSQFQIIRTMSLDLRSSVRLCHPRTRHIMAQTSRKWMAGTSELAIRY